MKSYKNSASELLAKGDKWTDEMAREALPILLWAAQHRRTITYKQLAEELESRTGDPIKRRMTLYGKPAGKIGDALILLADETGWDIPPLNAIVVNAATGLPGAGATSFIKRLLLPSLRSNITKGDAKALAEAAVENVLNYGHWSEVAKALQVKKLPPVQVLQEEESLDTPIQRPEVHPKAGSYPESSQHKALKHWAASHPKFFSRFGKFPKGKTEADLESGDRLDALLSNRETRLAIEVKAGNAPESEVFRGIFQCIKYQATLRAMQLADCQIPNAKSVLLLTKKMSAEANRLAKKLQVTVLIAPNGADHG